MLQQQAESETSWAILEKNEKGRRGMHEPVITGLLEINQAKLHLTLDDSVHVT